MLKMGLCLKVFIPSCVANLGPGEVMCGDWASGSRIDASARGSNVVVELLRGGVDKKGNLCYN